QHNSEQDNSAQLLSATQFRAISQRNTIPSKTILRNYSAQHNSKQDNSAQLQFRAMTVTLK
ncbi:hypothetical protein SK128_013918, partial [Halocaridina rubra]